MSKLTIQDKFDLWDIYYNLTLYPVNTKEQAAASALKSFLERESNAR